MSSIYETYDTELNAVVLDAFSTDQIPTYVVGIGIVDLDVGAVSCDPSMGNTMCTPTDPSLVCCDVGDSNCAPNTCTQASNNPRDVNPFDELTAVAVAGGVPNPVTMGFYAGNSQADLDAALNQITSNIFSCTVTLNPAPVPIQSALVTITVNGIDYDTPLAGATECLTQNGWYWSNSFTEITLCNTMCDDLKLTNALSAEYGCPGGGG